MDARTRAEHCSSFSLTSGHAAETFTTSTLSTTCAVYIRSPSREGGAAEAVASHSAPEAQGRSQRRLDSQRQEDLWRACAAMRLYVRALHRSSRTGREGPPGANQLISADTGQGLMEFRWLALGCIPLGQCGQGTRTLRSRTYLVPRGCVR